jgi:hypothetical protein
MTETIKQLDKLFKVNTLLSNELSVYPQQNCILINMLIGLVNDNYVFSQQHFNHFIKQACIESESGSCFLQSYYEEHKIVTKYMLLHNNITEKQFNKMCDILSKSFNMSHYCIDILFLKKYNFTISCYESLCKINYRYPPVNNYTSLHGNLIYACCMHIMSSPNYKKFKYCLNIIEQNKEPFNIKYLEIILCCLSKYKNIKNKHEDLKLFFDALFLNFDISNPNEIFQLIINKKVTLHISSNYMIFDYFIDKFGYNDIFSKYLEEHIISYNPEYLLKLMLKGFVPNIDVLNMMIDKYDRKHFYITKNDDYIPLGFTKKFFEDGDAPDTYVKIKIINLFEILNINPNLNTLNIICKGNGDEYVDILLNKYKITPEKETLDICIPTLNIHLINKILNFKITPDNKTFYSFEKCSDDNISEHETVRQITELLISRGLVINFAHIEYLLSKNNYLENLERFEILYDEKLYFTCFLYDNYPDEYNDKFIFDKTILNMHYLCASKKLTLEKLIKYLKTYNVKLDGYSIDRLFFHNSHVCDTVMIKYGCIPHILTTYRYSQIPIDSCLEQIIKKYNIGFMDMLKQYEMSI